MNRVPRRWVVLLAVAGAALLTIAFAGPSLLRSTLAARSDNTIREGTRLVAREGCEACHRAPFRQDLMNPGSQFGTVPGFDGGELAMYARSRAEVLGWIRDGGIGTAPPEGQVIHMPAFGERLSADEIERMADYVIAVNAWMTPEDPLAQRGEEIARVQCLSCHGPGGSGGLHNPGSIGGYVPALWGPDFDDLVRDNEELAEWIRTGRSARLARWPFVERAWNRQTVRMPAFGDALSDDDLAALTAYVRWLGETDGGTRPPP